MKRYALKGVNDDESECAVCGKVELKRVMWLVELDADGNPIGEPFHCGTSCGAKLMGYSQSKIATKVKNFAGKVAEQRFIIQYQKEREFGYYDLLHKLNKLNLSYTERCKHPMYIQATEAMNRAKAYADAQEITIEM